MSEHNLDDFGVGDVISKSFNTYFKNIIPFSLIGLLMVSPLYIYAFLVLGTSNIDLIGATGGTDLGSVLLGGIISGLLYMVLTYVAYAAITFGTVRALQGKPASFSEILTRGFATMFPVLGVAIVSGIAIGFGMILFIIPGIIISVIIYVAIPVAVLEKPGVFMSLSRSADLTKGFRWKVLGIAIVVFVISFIVSFAAAFVVGTEGLVALFLNLIADALVIAVGAVFIAVTYQELRRVKEGVDIDTIASVFS